MEIVKYPNDILNNPCSVVMEFDSKLHSLLDDMKTTMLEAKGIGLAANQVGLDMSMFIMKTLSGEIVELINPIIVNFSDEKANLMEGCLSAPGEYDIIDRWAEVELEFEDRNGNAVRRTFKGLEAVCAQHEYDHLEGIFFFSKMKLNRQRRRGLEKRWGKL